MRAMIKVVPHSRYVNADFTASIHTSGQPFLDSLASYHPTQTSSCVGDSKHGGTWNTTRLDVLDWTTVLLTALYPTANRCGGCILRPCMGRAVRAPGMQTHWFPESVHSYSSQRTHCPYRTYCKTFLAVRKLPGFRGRSG